MNLNGIDWSRAQTLLLKLVEVLVPLTDRNRPDSVVLTRPFFIPPSAEEIHALRCPVRILTTLHSVQKQVEEWVGKEVENGESPSSEKPPISKQAKQLIMQVQNAIGKLCTSTNIQNPEEAPLRETLKTLKPHLDQIIEAVKHEGMHTPSDGLPPSFRYPVATPVRAHLLKKAIHFPEAEAFQPKKGMHIHHAELAPKTQEEKISLKRVIEPKIEPEEKKRGGEAKVFSETVPNITPQENEAAPRSIEPHTLPGAPYVAQQKNITPAPKKKKRKGFWFRDDEEERNNP